MISRGELLAIILELDEKHLVYENRYGRHITAVEKDDGRQSLLKTILQFFNKYDKNNNDLLNKKEALKFFSKLLNWASKKFRTK